MSIRRAMISQRHFYVQNEIRKQRYKQSKRRIEISKIGEVHIPMSQPKYVKRKKFQDRAIVQAIQELTVYLYTVLSNEKFIARRFRPNIVNDILHETNSLMAEIYEAFDNEPKHLGQMMTYKQYQRQVKNYYVRCVALINVAKDLPGINIKNDSHVAELITRVRDRYDNWVGNNYKKQARLPTEEVYVAQRRASARKRQEKIEWNLQDPYRDSEGFVHLKPRNPLFSYATPYLNREPENWETEKYKSGYKHHGKGKSKIGKGLQNIEPGIVVNHYALTSEIMD